MARGAEIGFNDDLRLLADIVWMKLLKLANQLCRAACRDVGIIFDCFRNFEAGVICHIVLQYIKNKAFLDRLPHAVNMEGMETAILVFGGSCAFRG